MRIDFFLIIGMLYYGYVRTTGDQAMGRFAAMQNTYLNTIDQYSGVAPGASSQSP